MWGKLSLPETYIQITLLMVRHALMKSQWSNVEVETVVPAITDHLAVFLRMKREAQLLQRGWGPRKINT
jgi:hypothetical protein